MVQLIRQRSEPIDIPVVIPAAIICQSLLLTQPAGESPLNQLASPFGLRGGVRQIRTDVHAGMSMLKTSDVTP